MNIKNISLALDSLVPNSKWHYTEGVLTWLDESQTKPTEEEVAQKVAELEYQEEVNEYQRQRAREYPSYADQFDQIYHEGIDAWKATVQAVKDKYPKVTMDADELERRKQQAVSDLENT